MPGRRMFSAVGAIPAPRLVAREAADSTRRVALTLSLGLLAAACKTGGGRTTGTPPQQDGRYEFVARTGRDDLRGTLTLMSGESLLETETGYCRLESLQTDMQVRRYTCTSRDDIEGLVYIIDRHAPLTRSRWRGSVSQTRQRQVCVRYETRNNRQVCVQYRNESYEVSVPVGGTLTFTRRQG